MCSFQIKPRAFLHVSKSRNIVRYFVVDIFLSSSIVERHIFSNRREFKSFLTHVQKVMPCYHNNNLLLSYDDYFIFSEDLTDEFTFNL